VHSRAGNARVCLERTPAAFETTVDVQIPVLLLTCRARAGFTLSTPRVDDAAMGEVVHLQLRPLRCEGARVRVLNSEDLHTRDLLVAVR
jgi:hypothetical protein